MNLKRYKTLALLASVYLSMGSMADSIVVENLNDISTTDLFENATVKGSYNIWENSDARDAFGGEFGSVESGNIMSGNTSETSWIYFQTASSVSVTQFTISLAEDGGGDNPGSRSAENLKLFMATEGGTIGTDWTLIFEKEINPDYTTYGGSQIKVIATFDAAVANQDWRVEWTPATGDPSGARLLEVDATIPEPAILSLITLACGGLIISRRCGLLG